MNELDRAIDIAGGVVKLAKAVGVVQAAVSNWRARGGTVPVEHCIAIERVTSGQVRCEQLRPDRAEDFAYLRASYQQQLAQSGTQQGVAHG
jgi:DNA-binding transcriptional regulator YdaS (Cro superfamily)